MPLFLCGVQEVSKVLRAPFLLSTFVFESSFAMGSCFRSVQFCPLPKYIYKELENFGVKCNCFTKWSSMLIGLVVTELSS